MATNTYCEVCTIVFHAMCTNWEICLHLCKELGLSFPQDWISTIFIACMFTSTAAELSPSVLTNLKNQPHVQPYTNANQIQRLYCYHTQLYVHRYARTKWGSMASWYVHTALKWESMHVEEASKRQSRPLHLTSRQAQVPVLGVVVLQLPLHEGQGYFVMLGEMEPCYLM